MFALVLVVSRHADRFVSFVVCCLIDSIDRMEKKDQKSSPAAALSAKVAATTTTKAAATATAKAAAAATTKAAAAPKRKAQKDAKVDSGSESEGEEVKPTRAKSTAKAGEKKSAPSVNYTVDSEERHVFRWPQEAKAFFNHVKEEGFGVAVPSASLVPENDDLMLEALKDMGIDLITFREELKACASDDSKTRHDILTRAIKYYVVNRCGNIGNGIVNGKVKRTNAKSSAVATHIGHSAWAWTYRQHPTMLAIADLLVGPGSKRVGFDSVNVGGTGKKGWFHVDVAQHKYQEPIEKEGYFPDVQMMHNARACTKETGGFVCIPKSHLQHADVVRRAQQPRKVGGKMKAGAKHNQNFIVLPVDERTGEYTEPVMSDRTELLVTAPANSVTVWLSQLIHCNGAGKTKITKTSTPSTVKSLADLFTRSIVYMSYYRAELCTESDDRRIALFNSGDTTNHSPIDASLKVAGFRDKIHTLPIRPYEPVKLTTAGLNLIAPASKHHLIHQKPTAAAA